ncbi:MAG: hypothetical protein L3J83_12745 [Proteobacteria bacterium]|nr:hypothetical protein [Pseudomonadota bacterium]
MKNKTKTMVKVFSFCIIAYAVGLKFIPENMPFSAQPAQDDFYAPHAGQCVPKLEF